MYQSSSDLSHQFDTCETAQSIFSRFLVGCTGMGMKDTPARLCCLYATQSLQMQLHFKKWPVCCGLIHCLWGIYCIASVDYQTDRRVGKSTSPNANQNRSVCLLKLPRDDIHILYHPVDSTEAMRWEGASYFPCLKIGHQIQHDMH